MSRGTGTDVGQADASYGATPAGADEHVAPGGGEVAAIEIDVLSSQAGRSSAYLLRSGSTGVLVDCGPGTTGALDRAGLLDRLDAVVITHQHADHVSDVIGLAYARCFPDPLARIPLYAPEATLDALGRLDDLFAVPTLPSMGHTIATSFDLQVLPMDGTAVPLAGVGDGDDDPGVRLASFPARHAVPSAALRFTAGAGVDPGVGGAGAAVAFSSDTCRCDGVVAAAQDSDLFLCEATYLTASRAELEGHGHLTPGQAAQLAADADVQHLALIHLAHPAAHVAAARAASSAFDPQRITVATQGQRLRIRPDAPPR